MAELIKAAEDGNIPEMKRIIYPGWIFPRMVLSEFYGKSHPNIRKNIAEFVGVYGIDINAVDNYCGKTALHFASRWGKTDYVEILLKNGADHTWQATAGHFKGKTAYQIARKYTRAEVKVVFHKYGIHQ